MTLSVVTVTWNSAECITRQIDAVSRACAGLSFEHIVVDNNSTDNTVAVVRGQGRVQLIENSENKGFAAANNQGLAVAQGEYILFLNPDMEPDLHMVQGLLAHMQKDASIAIVGSRLISLRGMFQAEAAPRRFPRLLDLFLMISKIGKMFPSTLCSYRYADMDLSKVQQVDSVRGSCMLMRRSFVAECGFAFDPRYFFWFEDVDICREAYARGYKVLYAANTTCIDLVGQSVKKRNILWKQLRFATGMRVYIHKWVPFWRRFLLEFVLTVYIGLLSFLRRVI